ncbi:molybdopterin molybdotransferase MoeA [Methylobacterium nonmethylotrophicum]|uniref:Molybdopterin molybdenumtransferase n=2 Tax=Methylobacterium nonmethylotrophicum TaxID=1141884 RepID=A0A4Z0NE97_9HYPH|nr:molybdopterin molybdotransferase MoeA [Methylobacterium nonmethylotrophicum]
MHAPRLDSCAEARGLLLPDAACDAAAAHAWSIEAAEEVPLRQAAGRTLATPVIATVSLPAFDQAAMDGYAFVTGGREIPPGTCMPVVGRVAAGQSARELATDQAMRIFTGAPLPVGADAVLMQEHARRDEDVVITSRAVVPGNNVRKRGEDVRVGEALLEPGTRLDARHVALLAAQGHPAVTVRRRIRVGVISTGDELREPGNALDPAAIYDSNRPMLLALAEAAGFEAVDGGCVHDTPVDLARSLTALAAGCDLLVTTGGASIGEEDHAATAAALAGATFETLRMALKPGKPAVVGRIGGAAYLGLPGNPVAALVSWLLLGRAMTASLEGRPVIRRPGLKLRVANTYERRPGRTEFVPARIAAGTVHILGRGGSSRLRPLIEADGLVEIGPEHAPVASGSVVAFHSFCDRFLV